MAIKETEVEIKYNPKTFKYYEDLGYKFNRYINKKGKEVVKRSTTIKVKIEDLQKGSTIYLTKICDICDCEISMQQYYNIILNRNRSIDGLDKCNSCGHKTAIETQKKIKKENHCVAIANPELAELFWNKEEAFMYSCSSSQKVNFKCPNCKNKIENKEITYVNKYGVPCICKDGISYPEKFMYCLIEQLNINFEKEKKFEWSKSKRYDFYLNDLNVIIETHGLQHYKENKYENNKTRTLKEEQENDKIKELLAKENKIKYYVIVDCRFSEMDYIKNNILTSQLNNLFDLSKIDWKKCHKFALKSLVITACELYEKGYNVSNIMKILKVGRNAVIKYLKQGTLIDVCNFNPVESRRRKNKSNFDYNLNKKPVIQLSLNGEFIKEWESAKDVKNVLGINDTNISKVCKNKQKTAGGFKWKHKENYIS